MEDNSDSSSGTQTITLNGNASFSTAQAKFGSKSLFCSSSGNGFGGIPADNRFQVGTGALTVECWAYGTAKSGGHQSLIGKWTGGSIFDMRYEASDASGNFGLHDNTSMRNSGQSSGLNGWHHFAWTRDGSSNNTLWYDGVSKVTWTNNNNMSFGTNSFYLGQLDGSVEFDGYIDEARISTIARYSSAFTPNGSTTTNATGTLIQSANTVGSAKTKVGGTILYKDNQGTCTLGTDLKIYFTCDGGSNWTEASSYSAITPVYSTGIKQVRLGETTCTSGTDVRYKAVWANQAASSKETQLHGIGINY